MRATHKLALPAAPTVGRQLRRVRVVLLVEGIAASAIHVLAAFAAGVFSPVEHPFVAAAFLALPPVLVLSILNDGVAAVLRWRFAVAAWHLAVLGLHFSFWTGFVVAPPARDPGVFHSWCVLCLLMALALGHIESVFQRFLARRVSTGAFQRVGLSNRRIHKLSAMLLTLIGMIFWSMSRSGVPLGIGPLLILVLSFLLLAGGAACSLYAFIDRKLPTNWTLWRCAGTVLMLTGILFALVSIALVALDGLTHPAHAVLGGLALVLGAVLLLPVATAEWRYHRGARTHDG